MPRLCSCLVPILLFLAVGAPSAVSAAPLQADEESPLTVAYVPIRPFAYLDEQGDQAGFLIELAHEIGAEVKVDVRFQDVEGSQELVSRQATGETTMIAGVARLPTLADTNVFSQPVATETLRLVVLSENDGASLEGLRGARIGIVPPAVGSEVEELLTVNQPIEFGTPEQAMANLLTGDVEAVLLPNPVVVSLSRAMGVDDRVSFIGPVLREIERVVALHDSRADLLPAVNAAIDRMETDGRLEALRRRHFLETPASAPDIMIIGVTHSPPFVAIADDGEVSGYSVEVFRDLADRAGLDYRIVELQSESYFSSVARGSVDAIPLVTPSTEIRAQFDVTLPVGVERLACFVRTGSNGNRCQALSGAKIATKADVASTLVESGYFETQIQTIDDEAELVGALLDGTVEAIIYDRDSIAYTIEAQGAQEDIELSQADVLRVDSAIGLRWGMGVAREQLNAVIPSYLLSEDFQALENEYFGTPEFWTARRLYGAAGAATAVALSLVGYSAAQRARRRREAFERQQQELARETEQTERLSKLVAELEAANREQAEFTYSISHDLKAPNNTMGLLIDELAQFGAVGEGGLDVLSNMRLANQRMGDIVDGVTHYSLLLDGELPTEPLDLNAIVDNLIFDLAAEIAEAQAAVTRDDLPSITGNPAQIRSLLQNVMSNAIKFRSPEREATVHISSEKRDGLIIVGVADNGIGIPEEQAEQVFSLFTRLHTHSSIPGTGLGLAVSRRVMLNHGGTIDLRSNTRGGTTFDLTFQETTST